MKPMTLVENKDYQGYVDLMYIGNPNVTDINDQRIWSPTSLDKI